jgi:hypothetical protein
VSKTATEYLLEALEKVGVKPVYSVVGENPLPESRLVQPHSVAKQRSRSFAMLGVGGERVASTRPIGRLASARRGVSRVTGHSRVIALRWPNQSNKDTGP